MADAIEQSKASALAAFRAGRKAGHLDAMQALIGLVNETEELDARLVLHEACDRVALLPATQQEGEG